MGTKKILVSLPESLIKRLDIYVTRKKDKGASELNRSSAIRKFVRQGLDKLKGQS